MLLNLHFNYVTSVASKFLKNLFLACLDKWLTAAPQAAFNWTNSSSKLCLFKKQHKIIVFKGAHKNNSKQILVKKVHIKLESTKIELLESTHSLNKYS